MVSVCNQNMADEHLCCVGIADAQANTPRSITVTDTKKKALRLRVADLGSSSSGASTVAKVRSDRRLAKVETARGLKMEGFEEKLDAALQLFRDRPRRGWK